MVTLAELGVDAKDRPTGDWAVGGPPPEATRDPGGKGNEAPGPMQNPAPESADGRDAPEGERYANGETWGKDALEVRRQAAVWGTHDWSHHAIIPSHLHLCWGAGRLE